MKEVSMWIKIASVVIMLLLGFSGTMMAMLYAHQVEATASLELKLDDAVKTLAGRLGKVETALSANGTNIDNLVVTCADIKKDIRELRSP